MSNLPQVIGSLALAIIPLAIWSHFFIKKSNKDRSVLVFTFIIGALAVFPILLYKALWKYFPWMNAFELADNYQDVTISISSSLAIPLSVIITFMIVGAVEEVLKMAPIKVVNQKALTNIDDAIEFFIISALGFSFMENVLYFYNIWVTQGGQDLVVPFLFRSTFSTFAHILFSGIFGYFYGVAHFAKPALQKEIRSKRHKVTTFLHKIFSVRKEKGFRDEKVLEGLLIAVGLHAVFNIFLEVGLTFLVIPFLLAGYFYLDHLLNKKENQRVYKKLRQSS